MTWERAVLGDILDVSIGGIWGKGPGEDEVDVRVWRVTELKTGGRMEQETAARRSVTTKQLSPRSLQPGDLLLEKSGGGPKTPVGRVGLVRTVEEPSVCANFMQLMRPNPGKAEPRFLHLYLNHFHEVGGTERMQTASTNIRNIKASEYVKIEVPLPALEEQRRIVAILEEHLSRLEVADALLDQAKRRLAALERAALDAHFGNGDVMVTLDELIEDISAGKSFGGSNASAGPYEWGIIRVSAMTWGQFRAEENKAVAGDRVDPRFEIKAGDLLISRANTVDYVGASVLVGEVRPKLLLSDKSLRVTPRVGIETKWLWRALQSPSARSQIAALATGTKDSMRNISQVSLRKVSIPRRTQSEQCRAVTAFERVAESIAEARAVIDLQRCRSAALRRALLAAAFSGRLTETIGS